MKDLAMLINDIRNDLPQRANRSFFHHWSGTKDRHDQMFVNATSRLFDFVFIFAVIVAIVSAKSVSQREGVG